MTYYIAMVTNILVLLCILLNIPWIKKQSILNKIMYIIFIIAFSVLVPIHMGYNILWMMHGTTSDLSITTFLLALLIVVKNLFNLDFKIFSKAFAIIVISVGTVLYLSALGFTSFSIYDVGFIPNIYLLLGFLVVEIILWRCSKLSACLWLVAFIAYYFRLQTSINLWDYLMDPLLFFVLLVVFLKKIF